MKKTVLAVLLMLGLMLTQQAWAVTLDFNMDATHPGGALIQYVGGATPLVGSNISVDLVQDADNLSDPAHKLFGGTLAFTTGNLIGSDAFGWSFAPGGSFALIGGVDLNNNLVEDAGDIPSGTPLITSGLFTGTARVSYTGTTFHVVIGTFEDEKNQQLAEFYGLNANGFGYGWAGGFNLSFEAPVGAPPTAFTSTKVLSGDITNSPRVPEPASTSLLGLGLLGFVGKVVRKKFKA